MWMMRIKLAVLSSAPFGKSAGVERALWDSRKAFSVFCLKLADRNARGWLKVMQEPGSLQWLISEMQRKNLGDFVGQLLFSNRAGSRQLGFFLFDELAIESLPAKTAIG